jgi:hypothetical protein
MIQSIPELIKFPDYLLGVWVGNIGTDLIKITLDLSTQTQRLIGWFRKSRVVAGLPVEEDEKIFESATYDPNTKILILRHLDLGIITCWLNPTQIIGKTGMDYHVNLMKQDRTII